MHNKNYIKTIFLGLSITTSLISIPKLSSASDHTTYTEIKQINIEGESILSAKDLEKCIEDIEADKITMNDIMKITEDITKQYIDKGFIFSKAIVPKQVIKDGIITIVMLEPKIENIIIENPQQKISDETIKEIIEKVIKKGNVINIRDIEKIILLLNERAGVIVKGDLVKIKNNNSFNFVVKVTSLKNFTAGITIDNFGNPDLGRAQASGFFNYYNPFKKGDTFIFEFGGSGEEMLYAKAGYNIPINYYGTKLSLGAAHIKYLIPNFTNLKPEGNANVVSIGITQPITKSLSSQIETGLIYEYKTLKNITTLNINTTKDINAGKWNLNGKFSNNILNGGNLSTNFSYNYGYLKLNDETDRVQDLATKKSAGNFSKITYNAELFQRLNNKFSTNILLRGQHALNNLDPLEKGSFAGPNGVRAYSSEEGLADNGFLARGELIYNLNVKQNSIWLGPFIDYGHLSLHNKVWNGWQGSNTNLKNNYDLLGTGFRINFAPWKGISADFTAAKQLKVNLNKSNGSCQKGKQFWFQVKKYFN
ncbi:MAG: ShlB/FhaC/HecB family hemolysin secretion/activation protein [Sphingobacteriia bacterium]|nr:ShlB/FhaC/HecB family hemolysin secretion/activation protein [Sphingobacteriia bacterium]